MKTCIALHYTSTGKQQVLMSAVTFPLWKMAIFVNIIGILMCINNKYFMKLLQFM